MYKLLFNFSLNFLDSIFWVVLRLISGEFLMKLLRNNKLNKIHININQDKIFGIKNRIRKFCSKKTKFTSCLSKSITVKFILDFLNIENKLYLGISKLSNGQKMAHAWIVDPNSGEMITPGLSKNKGLIIYVF